RVDQATALQSRPHTSPNRGAPITAALLRSAVSSVRYSATDSRAGHQCVPRQRPRGRRSRRFRRWPGPRPTTARWRATRGRPRVTDATGFRDIDTWSRSVVRHRSTARTGVSASPRRPIALLVGLCALACSVAACCLSIFELGLGSRGGCLLGRRNRGLFFALGGFGRILSLGSHVVGLLLCGGGRRLGILRRGVLPLFGSGPRFLDLTLFRCARVFLVPDRVVALGLQFVVGLLVLLGRCRVELGRPVQRITVFDERSTALLQLWVAQQVADGRVQRSQTHPNSHLFLD